MKPTQKLLWLLKVLLLCNLFTLAALLLLSFLEYRLEFSSTVVNIAILFIYIITCFLGGLCMGKKVKERRFLWGILLGGSYIFILLLISLAFHHGVDLNEPTNLSTAVLCLASGMLGGMVS